MKLAIASLLAAAAFAGSIGAYFDDLKALTNPLTPINNVLNQQAR